MARGAHQHLTSMLAQSICLDQYARAVVRRCPRFLWGVQLDELALVDLVEACEENWVLAFCKPVQIMLERFFGYLLYICLVVTI